MAEVSGDLLTVSTPQGNVDAKRMGRAEAGQSRWWIKYPWAAESFYGTAQQAVAHINRRAKEQGAQELGRR
jgi:hypothetical protein